MGSPGSVYNNFRNAQRFRSHNKRKGSKEKKQNSFLVCPKRNLHDSLKDQLKNGDDADDLLKARFAMFSIPILNEKFKFKDVVSQVLDKSSTEYQRKLRQKKSTTTDLKNMMANLRRSLSRKISDRGSEMNAASLKRKKDEKKPLKHS